MQGNLASVHEKRRTQSTTSMGESHLLRNLANFDVPTVYRTLLTSERGLTDLQVQHARRQYGTNVVAHELPVPWYRRLLHYCRNPFILVLLVLGTVSGVTGDLKATAIVSVMVGLSVLIQFVQESRSSHTNQCLRRDAPGLPLGALYTGSGW